LPPSPKGENGGDWSEDCDEWVKQRIGIIFTENNFES
jgi:hypothetical protein